MAIAFALFTSTASALEAETRTLPFQGSRIVFDGGLAENEVALSFGGAIDADVTTQLLDILEAYDVRGHFFVSGISALTNIGLIERILKAGHVVGSGGYGKTLVTEEDTTFETVAQKIESEIIAGHEMVYTTGGIVYPFIRFPAGRDTLQARTFVNHSNVYAFYWNIDYEKENPAESIKQSLEREGNRGISSISLGKKESTFALVALLEEMKAKGIKVITFQPPGEIEWRKYPPLIRNQLYEAVQEKGSLIQQSHADLKI